VISHQGELTVEAVAQKTSYISAMAGVFFGLTWNEIGIIVSIILGFLSYITSLFFQWRRDRREELAIRVRVERD